MEKCEMSQKKIIPVGIKITVEVAVEDRAHILAKVLLLLQLWRQISGSLLPYAAGAAELERSGCGPVWPVLAAGAAGTVVP